MTQERSNSANRITRSHVAKMLGVSVATVRRLEGNELNPTSDSDGVHWFNAAEVEALALKRKPVGGRNAARLAPAAPARPRPATGPASGDDAAAAFAEFESGVEPSSVVMRLRLAPDVVRDLYKSWADLKGLAPPDALLKRQVEELLGWRAQMSARVDGALDRLARLPVPPANAFTCSSCGDSGNVAVPMTCTACGTTTQLGFWPES